MIIEEFMLAANETVAEHFFWMEVPFLYRVHEPPAVEKMVLLNEFVHNFGYHLKAAGNIHPRALQDLLTHVRGRAEEVVVSHVMLRSLKQARYAAESLGHFGLAAEYYSHFTSPIRRYPDLMIHRVIREVIAQGALSEERYAYLQAIMPEVAAESSERERTAVDAERETDLVKKIEFMLDKVGEEFDGMISGVTGFGLFVQLDNSVEGLIHVSYLDDDYYHYHEKLHALIGERMKRVYRIGDRLRVRILSASKESLSIDFALVAKLQGDEPTWIDDESHETGFGGGRKAGYAGGGKGNRAGAGAGGRDGSERKAGYAGGGKGNRSGARAGGRDDGERKAGFGGGRKSSGSGVRAGGRDSGEHARGATPGRGAKRTDGSTSITGRSPRSGISASGRAPASVGTGASRQSGHMLPSTGGYSQDIEARRVVAARKKRERQALQDIEVTIGAPVKDKARRRRHP